MLYEREITDPVMIQFIIMYTLGRINRTVERDLLVQIILTNCNIAYGDFLVCMDNLVTTGHVRMTRDKNNAEMYDLCEKGSEAEKAFRHNIPVYIKEPIAKTVHPMLEEEWRKKRVQGGILPAKRKGEYTVQCMLFGDDGTCLMDLNFYCATRDEGVEMFRRFKEHPDEVYTEVVRSLGSDRETEADDGDKQENKEDKNGEK